MTLEYKLKQPQSLFSVWARQSTTNINPAHHSIAIKNPVVIETDTTTKTDDTITSSTANSSSNKLFNSTTTCHAQIHVRKELEHTSEQLNSIRALKTSKLLSEEGEKKIKLLEKQQSRCEIKLKRLEQLRLSQAKYRRNKKLKLKRLIEKHPNAAIEYNLAVYDQTGQPSIEDRGQRSLLKVIIEIASRGAAADPFRSSNLQSPCMTLDELTERLTARGFVLSRSSTYLQLLPRRSNSTEGKRHVRTVPVRLIKANNDQHKKHVDQYFATNTSNHLKTLAGSFGSDAVCFLSQDDKARVPIGRPAARKQAPLLMHLDYKITLPDHDFVLAPGHKLIPSGIDSNLALKRKILNLLLVYAACVINEKKDVSYSGPTYITIRSGKHDSSTAETHHHDFSLLFDSKEFEPVMKINGQCKPIVIISVDGGPDENPRYAKTLASGVNLFKQYQLDCFFVVSNCPGRSAFNMVERRMAPLSNELAGLILPHDYFGTHLDDNGNTVDEQLEIRNFKRAGECLAEVWNELTIDSYPVACQYVEPVDKKDSSSSLNANTIDLHWLQIHVRQSQYLLQIIKCNNLKCCTQWQTSYSKVIPQRFLPSPFPFKVSSNGISIAELSDKDGRFVDLYQRLQLDNILPTVNVSYDYNCPSVQGELQKRTWPVCCLYHPSVAAMKRHKRLHSSKYLKEQKAVILKREKQVQVIDSNDSESGEENQDDIATQNQMNIINGAPLIENIFDFLASDFMEL
ncbi:unnamed protein product [Rotaria sp. Silwood1]|nr:unnamed protein product [Rotaria sp. Silwood1]